jgi:hypothetical protein
MHKAFSSQFSSLIGMVMSLLKLANLFRKSSDLGIPDFAVIFEVKTFDVTNSDLKHHDLLEIFNVILC